MKKDREKVNSKKGLGSKGIAENKQEQVPPTGAPCDKSNPDDPHHGEAGDYDEKCNWIPSV